MRIFSRVYSRMNGLARLNNTGNIEGAVTIAIYKQLSSHQVNEVDSSSECYSEYFINVMQFQVLNVIF